MTNRILFSTLFFVCASLQALEVASLHPLMSELAHKVGGDQVMVIELVGRNDDPHSFDPKPETLALVRSSRLVLASGKGLEASYLGDLRDGLRGDQEIFEVGRLIPSLTTHDANIASGCAPQPGGITIDPHWWHDVRHMRRAARYLANEFARIDPANAEFYQQNAREYRRDLQDLHAWVREEVAKIPQNHRILGTSSAAFGYFCQAYDFKAISIEGTHKERSPTAFELLGIIACLRENRVPILFPEVGANPKALEQIVRDTGIEMGTSLYADGVALPEGEGYIFMMRHNVNAVVSALGEG